MSLDWCGEELRRHDRERFVACLFAPPDRRDAFFAIHAVNHEIAKTRDVTTEQATGLIRLQWWRDAIGKIHDSGEVLQHQALTALAAAIGEYSLSQEHFERLITSRERDIEEDWRPATMDELEDYADATATPLILLSLEILGIDDAAARQAARHAGIASAMTGMLRAIPYAIPKRRLYLPRDIMEEHGVSEQKLYDFNKKEGLPEVVRKVAAKSGEHIDQARAVENLPKSAFPALIPATMAAQHLNVLRKADHDVFRAKVQNPPFMRELRLWARSLTGKV